MKLYKYLLIPIIITMIGLSSCKDENVYYQGAMMESKEFTVTKGKWEWNNNIGRYEYFIDFPQFTDYIFRYGAVNVSVFVDGVEHSLPYVHTYPNDPDDPYTETISCDMSPGDIGFFIQASDLYGEDYMLADYTFKVVMFWDGSR